MKNFLLYERLRRESRTPFPIGGGLAKLRPPYHKNRKNLFDPDRCAILKKPLRLFKNSKYSIFENKTQ